LESRVCGSGRGRLLRSLLMWGIRPMVCFRSYVRKEQGRRGLQGVYLPSVVCGVYVRSAFYEEENEELESVDEGNGVWIF